jgi:predicted short-subunit dehydrogenase-like oxidoreductase (DUF2520 family)
VIGPGRAGLSFGAALAAAGWDVLPPLDRRDDPAGAATGVDVLVIATPDTAIAQIAWCVQPVPSTLVMHLSGALGLDVLAPHSRRASLHPLVSMPDAVTGAAALASGAWFAVAGDPSVHAIVHALGGQVVEVDDDHRAAYHAAACIASNHLVGLLGHVERVASGAGVPLAAFLDLVRGTVDNVARLGPGAALTGPLARGDLATVERHLAALDPLERVTYEAMADATRRLLPCG